MTSAPVWEDGRGHAWPALQGDLRADTCVVGLGGSGLSAVLELRARGSSAIGIDAGIVGGGAAGRNGGFLLAGLPEFYHDAVAQWGRDRSYALYQQTLAELDRIAAEPGAAVRRVGSLRIAASDEELLDCDAQYDAMQADALPVERYHGPEGTGLLVPGDGAFNPLQRCRTLAARADAAGAQLFEHSAALEIAGNQVTLAHGSVRCDRVIVAVDGRLEQLLPELAGRVRTARLQMLATEPVPALTLPRPVYFRYGFEYWQQLPDHRIAIGGFRDWAGDPEWTTDQVVSDAVQQRLERLLQERLGVAAPITRRWAGLVGYSSGGLPVVAEARPGVWAIGGYNGTGNVIGSICGRGVAELALTGHAPLLDGLWPA
ncbi:MAG TPA: FAD-binding oxidoreductase [Gemmatimonadales bacterium]|jgi:glycine/D-amino acid oxidase-like deaminating enzyme